MTRGCGVSTAGYQQLSAMVRFEPCRLVYEILERQSHLALRLIACDH